jgi:hypothetical protein
MKPFENFLSSSVGLQRLSQSYLELRQYFQREGWSEKDLEKPPYYTETLMSLFFNFGDEQKELFKQVNDLGLKVEWNEFNRFIQPILEKINEITPLSNGNNERGN